MQKDNVMLFLLIFGIIVASPILFVHYMQGYRVKNDTTIKFANISLIVFPEEAFDEGYADGIVIITPEIYEISLSKLNITPNTVIKVKLYIRYAARREPAPRVLEIIFDLNRSGTLIPSKKGYIRLESFIYVEPSKVYVSEGKPAIAYLYINFSKSLIDAIIYNKVVLGRSELPSIQVDAYTPANNLSEKPYKYIAIGWRPLGGIRVTL